MAKFCELCGKGYLKGNLVCFSNKKSIKRSYPNLRKVKVSIDGAMSKLRVCTGCLSVAKMSGAAAAEAAAAK